MTENIDHLKLIDKTKMALYAPTFIERASAFATLCMIVFGIGVAFGFFGGAVVGTYKIVVYLLERLIS